MAENLTGLAFLVPGRLDQLTGGYLFDRRIVEGLRASGRDVAVIELAGTYPDADATARRSVAAALAALPDGAAAAIDGLALLGAADCLAAAAARLRLVAFVHHPLASETGLAAAVSARFAALEAELLRRLRGIICPSEETAAALHRYGVPRARIAIVPPGTDKPTEPVPLPLAAETDLRLLSVASVTPRKGHLMLVAALARLADLSWRLRCVGSLTRDPATTETLRRSIAESAIADRVTLVGESPQGDLAAEYLAADCFVLPSFHEGYGMAFAEALAYGLPVIAARAGAVPDTVPDSAGLLVPPGDVAALAAALRRVIVDSALRRRLAAGAREAGGKLPDWPQSVALWAAAFDQLIAAPGCAGETR
jgi:glycosyltransferase involved in cell wall biosynthesis